MNKSVFEEMINERLKRVESTIMKFDWSCRHTYSNWCAQTYKYVCHSAPLIKKTSEALPVGHLKTEMQKHYKEELGHEMFAHRDAKFFGLDASDAPELESTKGMYSYVDQYIENDPGAMYGYAFALENISKVYAPWISEKVMKSFNVETSNNHSKNIPASFLTLHAEVDQDHADCGIQALEHMSEKNKEVAITAMNQSFDNYENFLNGITDYVQSLLPKAQ
jgi:hypothetical protein